MCRKLKIADTKIIPCSEAGVFICSNGTDKNGQVAAICEGDSGSPLLDGNVLYGIASQRDGNCNARGIWVSVASQRKWIEQAVKSLSVTALASDTWETIAERNKVDKKMLQKWNKDLDMKNPAGKLVFLPPRPRPKGSQALFEV